MSDAWNVQASDEMLEQLRIRARYRLSELTVVLSNTCDRKSVSEIARALGCSRDKVIWLQHVLQLRNATQYGQMPRGKRPPGLGVRPYEPHGEAHTVAPEPKTFKGGGGGRG